MNKYIMTDVSIDFMGRKLFQVKALKSFGNVTEGELGGYIEKEDNLSQNGDAWVFGNAQVFGNAWVYGDARVSGDAQVYGDAWVFGNAWVYGDAQVFGDARVYGNARVSAKASFTLGWFIGGDDTGKIKDITSEMGNTFWKNQYVLGDYCITPIEEEKKERKLMLTDSEWKKFQEENNIN